MRLSSTHRHWRCPLPRPQTAVIANLEHRHSYVRKNAVLALTAIFNLPKGELLVPDAPELVERMLQNEQVGCGVWAAVMCLWQYRQAGSRAGAVVALCKGWRMAPLWHLSLVGRPSPCAAEHLAVAH